MICTNVQWGDQMEYEREFLAEIAYRYYINDMSQNEIATKYHIGRTTVSRLLKKAKELGLVEIQIQSVNPTILSLKDELTKKYQLSFIEISSNFQEETNGIDNPSFFSLAGKVLNSLIDANQTVGIAWGSTLSNVIANTKKKITKNVTFVPISGGPSSAHVNHHVNTLVYQLSQNFNGTPIFINAAAVQETKQISHQLLNANYFKDIQDYWEHMDLAIIGIGGILSNYNSLWRDFLTEEDYELLKLSDAVGDVFCRFINKEGDFIKGDLNDRTISILPEQFIKIPKRIGFATGKTKISAIKGLLDKKMINGLVTDEATAVKLI